jgi:hypothetical protein
MNKLLATLSALLLLIAPSQVEAERIEWIAYGQTLAQAQTGIDNPPAHHNGIIGEADLPYVVPEGYELHLTAWGVEAYDSSGTIVFAPWIGQTRAINKFLHSCAASTGSEECAGMLPILPAGTKLNGRLINGENITAVYSWYMRGYLVAVE